MSFAAVGISTLPILKTIELILIADSRGFGGFPMDLLSHVLSSESKRIIRCRYFHLKQIGLQLILIFRGS